MNQRKSQFQPNYPIEHPGAFLNEMLKLRGIKKKDFASRCGRPTKIISEIISGKGTITPATSLQFERVLGESAEFWLNLNSKYQLQQEREKERSKVTSEKLKKWVSQFPLAKMVEKGYVPERHSLNQQIDELLRFFGISSIDRYDDYWDSRAISARFKQNSHKECDKDAVAVWLRQGEILASEKSCQPYDKKSFLNMLPRIKELTVSPWNEIENALIDLCANVGVAVALVPNLPKTGLRGAAYWASRDKAVIVLSDRNKSEEQVWFAFFHEVAHLLLHSRKAICLSESIEEVAEQRYETEADQYAANLLIPSKEIERFREISGGDVSSVDENVIKFFAQFSGVSPGLFLYRLQYEGIVDWRTNLNRTLKRKVEFARL